MTVFRRRKQRTLGGLMQPSQLLLANKLLPRYKTKIDDDKKHLKWKQAKEAKYMKLMVFLVLLYILKRLVFPLSHETVNYFDNSIRRLWLYAEQSGVIEQFPVYSLHYDDDFPHFSLLEENYLAIREEAVALLQHNRQHVPRLIDLVESERKVGKVYKTDWKVFWFKMGLWIPENCARAHQTCALLEQIPDVSNAFFSVLEPHQHIEPHWGHYKGCVESAVCARMRACLQSLSSATHTICFFCSFSFSFLRYHLGLVVPEDNKNEDCFLRIRNDIEKNSTIKLQEREELLADGTKYYWKEGQGVMFDDNPLHDATNNSEGERVVLFLDVARKLPWYLDIVNKIAIYVANRQAQIASMRKRAILDEAAELIPIG